MGTLVEEIEVLVGEQRDVGHDERFAPNGGGRRPGRSGWGHGRTRYDQTVSTRPLSARALSRVMSAASTRPSAARASSPSFRGAVSMKTHACVSRRYLRPTPAPSLAEGAPELPADACEVVVRWHWPSLEEAEELAGPVVRHWVARHATFEIRGDLRRQGPALTPCACLECPLEGEGKAYGHGGVLRHGCILHRIAYTGKRTRYDPPMHGTRLGGGPPPSLAIPRPSQ